jgi:uncharacterized protein YjbI with pentapeptide repeats
VNFSGVNFESLENAKHMFYYSTALENVNFHGANLENITDLTEMFANTKSVNMADFSNVKF